MHPVSLVFTRSSAYAARDRIPAPDACVFNMHVVHVGPYVKRGAPILRTSRNASASPFAGPGHCAVVGAPGAGKALLFYHAWQRDPRARARKAAAGRRLMVSGVSYGRGAGRWPAVGERGVPHVSVGGVRTWVERLWLGNRTRRGSARIGTHRPGRQRVMRMV